jgi:hypothetical protein
MPALVVSSAGMHFSATSTVSTAPSTKATCRKAALSSDPPAHQPAQQPTFYHFVSQGAVQHALAVQVVEGGGRYVWNADAEVVVLRICSTTCSKIKHKHD